MCGIVGIVDAGGVSIQLYYALYALQHRGQESAGISTFDGTNLHKFKGNGLVADVFSPSVLSDLHGTAGIGHVRYPTTGANLPENIQPLNFQFKEHFISLAHNGNLVNTCEIRAEYEQAGQIFTTTTDTEVIAKILMDEIGRSGCVEDAVRICMRRLLGSYSVVMMFDGIIYAFRDPLGIKPFCIGKTENGYMVASESVAVDALSAKFLRDVKPGELIRIDSEGIRCTQVAVAGKRAHCIFEYIYFARADAIIDGVLVYDVRRQIGHKLFEEDPVRADSVCSVPDSGTAYAIGYAEGSGIPFVESLMKNRYMGRTFIMPTQKEREKAVRIKLNPIPAHLKNKSVVLVDDSIVRGTTSKRIIEMMREAGAREVHMRIGSPAIKAPCYLGVDMPTREELIASDKIEDEVRHSITATTLHHISLDALVEAIGFEREDLCTGCLTGCYPLPIDGEQARPCKVDFLDSTFQSRLGSFEA
ncbi:amidophosphoribosyltransferase [uncultured Methanoregula sp.]|uniref:amidophosphoribosyltransferase n=1 Tax=uncultured Methanoregula sp. TaxID=1005933 RepID=UPI002AAB31E9|nr:amidophosphoribosyltransferase [uncultured Methanoregula sp.]